MMRWLLWIVLIGCAGVQAQAPIPAPSIIYVGDGFRSAEAYYFYTNYVSAANRATGAVDFSSLRFYEGNTYTFERLGDLSPSNNHPFMLSDQPAGNGSYHFGNLSLTLQTSANLGSNGGLVNGESLSFTIPASYNGDLNYYCANPYHTEMVSSFNMGGDPTNTGLDAVDTSRLILTEVDFNASQVEVTYFGTTDAILEGAASLVIDGTNTVSVPAGTIFMAGSSVVIPVPSLSSSGHIWLKPAGSAGGANLFSDGNFDSGITGWSKSGQQSGTMQLDYDSVSEALELTGFNGGVEHWHAKLVYSLGQIDASKTYDLTADFTTDVGGTLRIYFRPSSSSAWGDRLYNVDVTLQAGLNSISEEIPLSASTNEVVVFEFQVGQLNGTSIEVDNINLSEPAVSTDAVSGLIYGGIPSSSSAEVQSAVSGKKWLSASAYVPYSATSGVLRLMALDATNPDYWVETTRNMGQFFDQQQIADPYPDIANGEIYIGLQTVNTNLSYPMGMVDPNDGTGRLFVYQQTGQILVLNSNRVLESTALMDIQSALHANGPDRFWYEFGLLGVALAPNFASNGTLYFCASYPPTPVADFSISDGGNVIHHSVLMERVFTDSNGNGFFDGSDSYTERELLRVEQPEADAFAGRSNHNSGRISFDQNGYLLLSFGDGGSLSDTGNGHGVIGNAQDSSNILGSIIRINPTGNNSVNGQYGIPADNPFVNDATKLDEIYAYGFRNPWTMGVDKLTGEIYSPDSGEQKIQELNLIEAGGNYGWRAKEGSFLFDPVSSLPGSIMNPESFGSVVDPIAEYDQSDAYVNIIGGFIYRGSAIPELQGTYVCGDYGGWATPGNLMYIDQVNGTNTFKTFKIGASNRTLASNVRVFAEDAQGELYFVGVEGSAGKLFKVVPVAGVSLSMSVADDEASVTVVGDEQSTLSLIHASSMSGMDAGTTNVLTESEATLTFPLEDQSFFKAIAE